MSNGNFKVPEPSNEPVLSYIEGSSEKQAVKKALKQAKSQEKDVPMYIGSKEIFNGVLSVFNKPKVNGRKIFVQNHPHDVPGDWFKGPF